MSPQDMKGLLRTVGKVSNKMDDKHLQIVQSILISAQRSNRCVFFRFLTLKQSVQYLVNELLKQKNILDLLDKTKTKTLYKILGRYNYFPTCALCGKMIDMSVISENQKRQPDDPLSFSWDHKYPKTLGGTTHLSNMQPAHKICNNKKSDALTYDCMPINIKINIPIPHQYKTLRPQIYINTQINCNVR